MGFCFCPTLPSKYRDLTDSKQPQKLVIYHWLPPRQLIVLMCSLSHLHNWTLHYWLRTWPRPDWLNWWVWLWLWVPVFEIHFHPVPWNLGTSGQVCINVVSYYHNAWTYNILDMIKCIPFRRIHGSIQYTPRNMHTVLLCFALLWLCNRS